MFVLLLVEENTQRNGAYSASYILDNLEWLFKILFMIFQECDEF